MASKGHPSVLPEGFYPSEFDVICGWARQNFHHEGNRRLRNRIYENVGEYNAAKTKHDKGLVIEKIVNLVREESPTLTGFVKLNPKTARWHYIGDDKARDKIGHALRKAVQSTNRPSKKRTKSAQSSVQSASDNKSEDDTTETSFQGHRASRADISSSGAKYEYQAAHQAVNPNPFARLHPQEAEFAAKRPTFQDTPEACNPNTPQFQEGKPQSDVSSKLPRTTFPPHVHTGIGHPPPLPNTPQSPHEFPQSSPFGRGIFDEFVFPQTDEARVDKKTSGLPHSLESSPLNTQHGSQSNATNSPRPAAPPVPSPPNPLSHPAPPPPPYPFYYPPSPLMMYPQYHMPPPMGYPPPFPLGFYHPYPPPPQPYLHHHYQHHLQQPQEQHPLQQQQRHQLQEQHTESLQNQSLATNGRFKLGLRTHQEQHLDSPIWPPQENQESVSRQSPRSIGDTQMLPRRQW